MAYKDYWETRLPQSYITTEQPGTAEYEHKVNTIRYRKHQYIKRFIAPQGLAGKKVLEIGSGIGTDLLYFKNCGAEVTGIDVTKSSIEICKKRFAFYGFSGEFRQMDAEKLSFADECFEVVYSFGVLHHLENTAKAIQEIHRVLKPNGHAFIRVNAKGWWYYLRIMLWQGIIRRKLFHLPKQEVINQNTTIAGASPLVKYYSKREVRELFRLFTTLRIERNYLGGKFAFLPYWLGERILAKIAGNHWMVEIAKNHKQPTSGFTSDS